MFAPAFRLTGVHFMKPSHGLIQALLVALKFPALDFFLRRMFDTPRTGPDVGGQDSIFFLPLSSAGSGFLPGTMT